MLGLRGYVAAPIKHDFTWQEAHNHSTRNSQSLDKKLTSLDKKLTIFRRTFTGQWPAIQACAWSMLGLRSNVAAPIKHDLTWQEAHNHLTRNSHHLTRNSPSFGGRSQGNGLRYKLVLDPCLAWGEMWQHQSNTISLDKKLTITWQEIHNHLTRNSPSFGGHSQGNGLRYKLVLDPCLALGAMWQHQSSTISLDKKLTITWQEAHHLLADIHRAMACDTSLCSGPKSNGTASATHIPLTQKPEGSGRVSAFPFQNSSRCLELRVWR